MFTIVPSLTTMKRTIAESESPSTEARPYRRQLPVSCSFCRSKKLKCDREHPCSNCASRSILCTSAVPGRNTVTSSHDEAGITRQPASLNTEDVLARLERLERNVFPESEHLLSSATAHSKASDPLQQIRTQPTGWYDVGDGTPSRSKDFGQTRYQVHTRMPAMHAIVRVKSSTILPAPPAVQDLSQLMLRTSKYEAFLLGKQVSDTNGISPEISSLSCQALQNRLPEEKTAKVLLAHFIDNISWTCRIVHGPTLRSDLHQLYESIRNGSLRVSVQKLSLLSACLAVAIHFGKQISIKPMTDEYAMKCRQNWTDLAEEALVESKHDERPTIETLQAVIIMGYFLPSTAIQSRYTSLDTILKSARAIGLHQLDSKRNCQRRVHGSYDFIDIEIKRRVWWHIVYTDWMLSYMSGPQEGTYLCHPLQMNVLLPTNTDDCHINANEIAQIHPIDRPTEVCHMTINYWLSSLIRSFTDLACSTGLEVDELEYDQVLLLDEQVNKCIKELPYYFQLDDASKMRSQEIDAERPYIAWAREMIHFGIHTRLSRLHRPFLTRGYKDPKYAYSRMTCLRSARVVIELEKSMRSSNNIMHSQSTSRLWVVVHHVFMATVTLVMDYCIDKDDPRNEDRKKEILDCYAILEMGKASSDIARKGLEHLKRVMNEWRGGAGSGSGDITPGIQPADASSAGRQNTQANAPSAQLNRDEQQVNVDNESAPEAPGEESILGMTGMNGTTMDFPHDLWFGQDVFEDAGQWDALFYELDNQSGAFGVNL